jgi:hypothetical protein
VQVDLCWSVGLNVVKSPTRLGSQITKLIQIRAAGFGGLKKKTRQNRKRSSKEKADDVR